MVIDTVESFGLDGREAEEALDRIGITTNKQVIPDDPRPPLRPSGVRLGTPACTARGMGDDDMKRIGAWMISVLRNPTGVALTEKTHAEVVEFCRAFPVPGID
jgi:glycine hydroxymethyltransferase